MAKRDGYSVVMSIYNGVRFLPELIYSIQREIGPNDEVLIFDDGSTDESVELLRLNGFNVFRSFPKAHFNLMCEGTQERITRNYFELIRMAKNEIVVLVDQDDVWLKGKLDFIRRNPGYDMYIHDARVINSENGLILESYQSLFGGFKKSRLSNLIFNQYLGCCMAVRKNSVIENLPVNICKYYYHDQILGLLLANSSVLYQDEKLLLYRRHDKSVTSSVFESDRSWRDKFCHRFSLLKFVWK